MLRKLLVIVVAAVIIGLCVGGCKKSSDTPPGDTEAPNTAVDYKAEAEKEITKENMDSELARLEKEIANDTEP
ncbi:MAG: hypothetical protein ACYTBJ_11955 [Planctomycetota bacterium]|jgi:hypothetical protein